MVELDVVSACAFYIRYRSVSAGLCMRHFWNDKQMGMFVRQVVDVVVSAPIQDTCIQCVLGMSLVRDDSCNTF